MFEGAIFQETFHHFVDNKSDAKVRLHYVERPAYDPLMIR